MLKNQCCIIKKRLKFKKALYIYFKNRCLFYYLNYFIILASKTEKESRNDDNNDISHNRRRETIRLWT